MPKEKPDVDSTRRTLLKTGAAVAAVAAAGRSFAQDGQQPAGTGFYERGDVRIRYNVTGSGFPLLLIAGGGLNSVFANFFNGRSPFDVIGEFAGEYRCISMDLRNAYSGQSTGPLEVDRPWDSHTDDQLGLMDHLGIDEFMVMGFCIGGPVHLEPAGAGAGANPRRRDRAARGIRPGHARLFLRRQHGRLGTGTACAALRTSRWKWSTPS